MTEPVAIRVVNYCGDYNDLNTINKIGPYPDADTRDRDMRRLAQLPGVDGSLSFQPATGDLVAEFYCTPQEVAGACDLQGVLEALGVVPRLDQPQVLPEPTIPGL